MAKIETHEIDGRADRSLRPSQRRHPRFWPRLARLPDAYRDIGQPVLVPGSMGTASWVLVGTEKSMAQSFGSTCHGAGRTMSRSQAKKDGARRRIAPGIGSEGIHIRAGSMPGLAEEAPQLTKMWIASLKWFMGPESPKKWPASCRLPSSKARPPAGRPHDQLLTPHVPPSNTSARRSSSSPAIWRP